MESQGEPGKIQATQAFYELVKDRFVLEAKGPVAVKGKGEMKTWYLVGERNPSYGTLNFCDPSR
jgi:class 3 adenylate cyclase